MCFINNGLWLPNLVSYKTTDKHAKNCSKSNGEENVRHKITGQSTMLRDQKKNEEKLTSQSTYQKKKKKKVMGWTYSRNKRQQKDQAWRRVATKE